MDRRWIAGVALAVMVGAVPVAQADDGTPAFKLKVGLDLDPETRGKLYLGAQPISLDEFLSISGHGDVVRRIESRHRLRVGLVAGGAVVILASAGIALWGESCDALHDQVGDCVDRTSHMRGIALVVAAAGAGSAIVGLELSSLRPTRGDLEEMAAAYNRGETREAARMRLIPYVGEGGGGVALARTW